jgi:protein transport protein SEC61 subunit gamma-like protein
MKLKQKLSSMSTRYRRVWRLLKKPTKKEYMLVVKVSAIGLAVVGVVGFLISTIMSFLNW